MINSRRFNIDVMLYSCVHISYWSVDLMISFLAFFLLQYYIMFQDQIMHLVVMSPLMGLSLLLFILFKKILNVFGGK